LREWASYSCFEGAQSDPRSRKPDLTEYQTQQIEETGDSHSDVSMAAPVEVKICARLAFRTRCRQIQVKRIPAAFLKNAAEEFGRNTNEGAVEAPPFRPLMPLSYCLPSSSSASAPAL
jgi:hypothetical protein